ncbi:MAG: UTP--glucose-1-phosphate uridylyltransferase [Mycoplasmataceae bacterium]|jgi:UTP--glucose-1-phosphate uridylyltransferase|nr:UTP--glucose-1-phosphate uridylyltransferase [Mycoplasmataceae bacterium]
MSIITKAIIPAAGLGTRFIPVTKSIPKEMIPILDVPSIDLVVQEAIDSGIKEILIIVSSTKQSLIDYYHTNHNLEKHLIEKKRLDLLERIKLIGKNVKIRFKFQKEPKGLGDAIYLGKKFTNGDPFIVMLGDDVTLYDDGRKTASQKLIDIFSKYHSTVLCVKEVEKCNLNKYGVIGGNFLNTSQNKLIAIKQIVEKPNPNKAPSNLAVIGRYVFTPEIYQYIKQKDKSVNGEIQITDAIATLMKNKPIYAWKYEGKHYDVGSKRGYVMATIDFALNDPIINREVFEYIKCIVKTKK